MTELKDLPNIGKTIEEKLRKIEINTHKELVEIGSKNAIIKISTLENSGVCINMLYAIEGAIQGLRWHGLDKERKQELRNFYKSILNEI